MAAKTPLSVTVCRNRLTKAFDAAFTEEQSKKAAFYIDTETETFYTWKFELNNQLQTWSINRLTGLISKQIKCKIK